MSKIVARSFYANGLPILARAYRTCKEKLGEKLEIPIDELDLTSITGEEACYLDIVQDCEQIHTRAETLSEKWKGELNETAGLLLDVFNGHGPTNHWPKFSPEFALSMQLRHIMVTS